MEAQKRDLRKLLAFLKVRSVSTAFLRHYFIRRPLSTDPRYKAKGQQLKENPGSIALPGKMDLFPSLDHQKKWTWELSPNLTSQITENHPIVPKVGPRRLPKCTQKSIKIDIWPSVCPLGVPLDPMITKMVSQVPKMEPEGLQNDSFR